MKIDEYIGARKRASILELAGTNIKIMRLEKSSSEYGPYYILQSDDGLAYNTTRSVTRQIDGWISEGVEVDSIPGHVYYVEKNHLEADPSKNILKSVDYIKLRYIEEDKGKAEKKGNEPGEKTIRSIFEFILFVLRILRFLKTSSSETPQEVLIRQNRKLKTFCRVTKKELSRHRGRFQRNG